jgi:hypothetical protein
MQLARCSRPLAGWFSSVLLAWTVCGSSWAAAPAQSAKPALVRLGGAEFSIPVPDGFVRVDGIHAGVDQALQASVPAGNVLLACFGAMEELPSVRQGQPPAGRTLSLQTLRSVPSAGMTLAEFQQVKQSIHTEMDQLIARHQDQLRALEKQEGERMSQQWKEPAEYKIVNVAPLGVFDESEHSISFSLLSTRQIRMQGRPAPLEFQVAISASTLLLEGKVLYAYCVSPYQSPEDLRWTRERLGRWTQEIRSIQMARQVPVRGAGGGRNRAWYALGAGLLAVGIIVQAGRARKKA